MDPSSTKGIAVAACGAVTALGLGVERLRQALLDNASGLRPAQRHAGKGYQSTVCGWVPEEVVQQLAAEDSQRADARAFLLARAALDEAKRGAAALLSLVPATRRGLVVSTTKADVEALERTLAGAAVSPVAQRHIQPALLAADLAATLGITGPTQCVSAACISGLVALGQGASLIQRGAADVVFVAGVDLVSHFVLAGFTALKALEPDGCRPFDKTRLGLSLGEGAGAVVLTRPYLLSSPAPTIRGWGVSNDANHLTGPSRDGSGLALAIERAFQHADWAPDTIDYVHAHGTGTPYNDNMESLALRRVFGERVPPFSSSKGMLGHTLGAAGVIETILCLLAFQSKILPGTPRLIECDPVAPESMVARPAPAPQLRRILKINCGFGGTNAALVLEKEER